jgi:hypothetical protein
MLVSFSWLIATVNFKNTLRTSVLNKLPSLKNPSFSALLFFGLSVMLTAVGVALSRGVDKEVMIVDRYMVYSVVALGCTYALLTVLIPNQWRKYWLVVALLGATFYNQYLYWYYTPEVAWWRQSLVADAFDLKHYDSVQGKLFPFGIDGPKPLHDAIQQGIYKFPTTELTPHEREILAPLTPDMQIDSTLRFRRSTGKLDAYDGVPIDYIHLDSIRRPVADIGEGIYLILKGETNERTYVAAPQWFRWEGYMAFLYDKGDYRGGFTAAIYQSNLVQGRYRLGLLTLKDRAASLRYSPDFFVVPDSPAMEVLRKKGYYQP